MPSNAVSDAANAKMFRSIFAPVLMRQSTIQLSGSYHRRSDAHDGQREAYEK
jgi:hypothetical protein